MLKLSVLQDDREVVLKFEHSLLSLSKWESKYGKPFLTQVTKTPEELISYYQDMLVSPEDEEDLVYALEPAQLEALFKYMNTNQSASQVPQTPTKTQPETTTSELIYYWLTGLQIPFYPTETWHISRLMMLVQITSYKQGPPKKTSQADLQAQYIAINEANKKKFNTSG